MDDIKQHAYKIFGKEKAEKWFDTENPVLDNKKPSTFLHTYQDRLRLRGVLVAIEFGEFS